MLRPPEAHLEEGKAPEEQAPVRRCWRFLGHRIGQFDYRSALAKGLPIGSGETESAHRHLIQCRLKMAGAWWKEGHVANVAQLRVTRADGHLE